MCQKLWKSEMVRLKAWVGLRNIDPTTKGTTNYLFSYGTRSQFWYIKMVNVLKGWMGVIKNTFLSLQKVPWVLFEFLPFWGSDTTPPTTPPPHKVFQKVPYLPWQPWSLERGGKKLFITNFYWRYKIFNTV